MVVSDSEANEEDYSRYSPLDAVRVLRPGHGALIHFCFVFGGPVKLGMWIAGISVVVLCFVC